MYRRATLALTAAGGALALLAGCGTAAIGSNDSSAPPKTELVHSIHALAKRSALTTTLSLDTTAANIMRIASLNGPSKLTMAQAQAIAGAHVTIETLAPKGKTMAQVEQAPSKASFALTVGTGSTTYLSLRAVNGALYLQAAVKNFLTLIGQSGEYATLQSRVASLPPFVKALVEGKWVSVSSVTLQAVEGFIKGEEHGKIPAAGKLQKLDQQLVTAVLGDLSVKRASTGKTDHLVIAGSLRKLAGSVVTVFAKIVPTVSQFGKIIVHAVPNLPIIFNAFVTGGALSSLTFNPGQFSKKKPFSLPIVASFSRSGAAITAPSGSTAITLGDLSGLMSLVREQSSASHPDYASPAAIPSAQA
jgi:hypothetical protein